MREQFNILMFILGMAEGFTVGVFVLVVLSCIVKGAWDDSVRLYNYLYIRWQERKDAKSRIANPNDREFFEVVSGFYDKV